MFSSHVSTVWFCCSISPIAPPVLSSSFHCLLGSDFCEVEMLNLLSPYSSIPPVGLLKPEPSALAASCAAPCPRRGIDISWRTLWMLRVGHLPSYQGDMTLKKMWLSSPSWWPWFVHLVIVFLIENSHPEEPQFSQTMARAPCRTFPMHLRCLRPSLTRSLGSLGCRADLY